jgi:predicted dehydrogenase
MPDVLRIGVVGLGWAGRTNLEAFQRQPDAEVVAISDANTEALQAAGDKYGITELYTDYTDLIERDDIDAIATATPNFLHPDVVIAAVESGKHALTEKPLAHTLEAAERMVAAATKHNRVLMMVHNQRYYGDVQTLKTYIDEGNVGRIYHAKAHWMRRAGIPGGGGWFSQKDKSGGGPLIDLGIHVLDMAMYLMGDPEPLSVTAASYAEHGRRGSGFRSTQIEDAKHDVEDFVTAFVRFEGGVTLTLDVSWTVYARYGDDFGVAVYGTTGGGEVDIRQYKRKDSLRLFTDAGGVPAVVTPKLPDGAGHGQVARNFLDAIQSGDWANEHGQSALKRTRIVDAIYRSAAEGGEIRFE